MKIIKKICSSIDDTIKYQLRTYDNYIIEACVIFFDEEIAKRNICISSQIGCACKCSFCSTGSKRFIRNLTSEEIIEQVNLVSNAISLSNKQLFEITYMGTGEPLNNYVAVFQSIKYLENHYINLHRVNVSTIFPHLDIPTDYFYSTKHPIHFQYSMHFVNDEQREQYFRTKLVPINDALAFFNSVAKQTNEDFCINYLLFDDLNDSKEDAIKLINLCKQSNAYVKVSQYCPIDGSNLKPSKNFLGFTKKLEEEKICWKPFQSKGVDIKASCGHLLSDIDF